VSTEPSTPTHESVDRRALALGLVIHAALAAAALGALLMLGVPGSYGVAFLAVLLTAGTAGTVLLLRPVRAAAPEIAAGGPVDSAQLRSARFAAVGELACSIAQGLRGPAARVSSLLAEVDGTGPTGAPPEAALAEARATARRLEAALRDLCEFVSPDGRDPVPYDIERLVRSTLDLVEGELRHRCDVNLRLDPLPAAVVHPRCAQHALAAALVVAAHSLPRRGALEIYARLEEEQVALRLDAVPADGPAAPTAGREVRTLDLELCEQLLAGTGGSLRSIRSRRGGMQLTLLLPAQAEVSRAA
jgi:hypothetical protein